MDATQYECDCCGLIIVLDNSHTDVSKYKCPACDLDRLRHFNSGMTPCAMGKFVLLEKDKD